MKMRAMGSAAVLALLLPGAAAAALRGEGGLNGFLAAGLQPETVARTLAQVEDDWKTQAATFTECNAHSEAMACRSTQQSFGKSCTTVVNAIVRGSSGDQDRISQYMDEVCAQKSLAAWHRGRCVDLQRAINGALRFTAYANREHFQSANLCENFWHSFVAAEQQRAEEERAARVKAQKEMLLRANARKKAAAEEKAKEEARKAQQHAEEAREAAAVKLARKKAEAQAAHDKAEALAKAAHEKMQRAAEEHLKEAKKAAAAAKAAEKAAEEHRQRQLEHAKAEERLKKLTREHQMVKIKEANAQKPSKVASSHILANASHKVVKPIKPSAVTAPNATKAKPQALATNATNQTKKF